MIKNFSEKKLVFILFFASGISSLVYQVVWLRMLSRVMGVTNHATATILASFMAGLAIGSFIFGKFADKRENPLRMFAYLQLGIAGAALLMPVFFRGSLFVYKYIYLSGNQNAGILTMPRVFISCLLLLIPTTFMGGTLPALTSYLVRKEGAFGKNFSLLYGLNTFGAVCGVLLSGFITIGALGEWSTIFIGVLVNFVVGIMAFKLHDKSEKSPAAKIRKNISSSQDKEISRYSDRIRKIVLASIFISGFTALSYEVIWSRQLILFLETSIYAFSAMLAVFLTGIAVGSIIINKFIDRLKTAVLFFGILELGVGVLSIFNLYLFAPLDASVTAKFYSPVILVFPITFLFGAIFPIASLCYTRSAKKAGSSVGRVFGFNTLGNVLGSFLTGFLFMGLIGSGNTVIFLAFINIALGLLLIWSEPAKPLAHKIKYLIIIPVVIFMSLGFKAKDPFLDVIEKRIRRKVPGCEIYLNKEYTEGTITSYGLNFYKGLLINGVGQTHLCTETKMMAHLPIMLADNPRKFLAVCFGMGTTVRSACIYDDLDVTAVDLVPVLFDCFKNYHHNAEDILKRKNISLVANDGRNFLLFSREKYDVITVDPSPPIYSAGTVNLYTKEFFSICKSRLTPGGVMCLWFPLGAGDCGGSADDFIYMVSTFRSVFPDMTVWRGPHGWGFFFIGTMRPKEIKKEDVKRFFSNPKLIKDITEYDNSCATAEQLLGLLIINKKNLDMFTNEAALITDNYPYTEFPLWRRLLRKDN
jgi:spermidine synthase